MSGLSIVSASAGSGKTHKITSEYMKLLYHDTEKYRHILAVTFTNKATEEMKSRIIRELFNLSTGRKSTYLDYISEQTGLNERAARLRSGLILKNILHDYSRFSVSTIDSFFQKLIRSFTREIGIQSGFSIELDTDSVLDKSIDRLFFDIESNNALMNWLIHFAQSRIEEGRSWNIKKDMLELGREVFKEDFRLIIDDVSVNPGNKELLSGYYEGLYKIIDHFEKNLSEKGERGLRLISANSLTVDDFSHKSGGPAGYFLKLAGGNFAEPGVWVRQALNNPEKWYSKSSGKKSEIEDILKNGLNKILNGSIDFFNKYHIDYKTATTILSNIFTLGILSDITGSILRYTNEKNIFLISDAAAFLNQIIDNNDTPFIYEKTGNYFHHFMIDEFQDTSGFQWNNFRPLIANSLSQNNDNLVVGDVKQSIYRWRDTNWEILSEKIRTEFHPESINSETLRENWRSRKEIIDFNNSFFTVAAKLLQDTFNNELVEFSDHETHEKLKTDIVDIYDDVCQTEARPDNSRKGYVRIKFQDNKDKDVTGEYLIHILKELQDKGYRLKDIAILTRKKIEGKEVAGLLIEYKNNNISDKKYKFDVISDESLYLSSSSAVNFMIAFLKYFINPEDSINNYFIVFEYLNYIKPGTVGADVNIPEYSADLKIKPGEYLPSSFINALERIKNLNLYEIVERLIQVFSLSTISGELPYIQAFQDLVLDYSVKNLSNINAFLEYWEDAGNSRSISISEAQDAIRIMTIHKSKGLEFKVVIIPYCNWSFNNYRKKQIIWCKPSKSPFDKLNVVPVNYSRELKNTLFAGEYFAERSKAYIDNLNLLYVAFTRASNALFCITGTDKKTGNGITDVYGILNKICSSETGSDKLKNGMYGSLVFDRFYNKEQNIFEYGSPGTVVPDKDSDKHTVNRINEYPTNDNRKKLRIAYQSSEFFAPDTDIMTKPLSYGKVMHEIFSDIVTVDDVEKAIEKVYIEGKIRLNEKDSIYKEITGILRDPRIRSWFSNNWKVITEKDIILPDGSVKRPDRVLIKDDSAIIIDYKFGMSERNEYLAQIREYALHLKEMGYMKTECFIWYINKGKIIEA